MIVDSNYMSFFIDDAQKDRLAKFYNETTVKPTAEKPFPTGASGGQYTYSFTPTTLGTVMEVTDNLSRRTVDLTNYNDW